MSAPAWPAAPKLACRTISPGDCAIKPVVTNGAEKEATPRVLRKLRREKWWFDIFEQCARITFHVRNKRLNIRSTKLSVKARIKVGIGAAVLIVGAIAYAKLDDGGEARLTKTRRSLAQQGFATNLSELSVSV